LNAAAALITFTGAVKEYKMHVMKTKEMMDYVRKAYPSARIEEGPTGWLIILNESSFNGIMMCGSSKRSVIVNAYNYVKKNF
jgi:hypothetical protein